MKNEETAFGVSQCHADEVKFFIFNSSFIIKKKQPACKPGSVPYII